MTAPRVRASRRGRSRRRDDILREVLAGNGGGHVAERTLDEMESGAILGAEGEETLRPLTPDVVFLGRTGSSGFTPSVGARG